LSEGLPESPEDLVGGFPPRSKLVAVLVAVEFRKMPKRIKASGKREAARDLI